MNWEKALQDYQHYLQIERGLSDNSISSYRFDVQKLIGYLDANGMDTITPITITEEEIQGFVYHISKSVNARTQARIISGLRGFFAYLVFEDYIPQNPVDLVESPKIGRKLPDTLSTREIDLLIAAIDLSRPEGERNRAILETLYGCGLRVSELTELKVSDLFFEEGFIKVTGKGNKQRFVPIAEQTIRYIEIYRKQIRVHLAIKNGFEDFLFLNRLGTSLTRVSVFNLVKQLVEKVGLKKKVSPHTFRHSFATHLLEHGADLRAIQLMLGHESITTTEIYMHLDRSHLKKVMKAYHPRG